MRQVAVFHEAEEAQIARSFLRSHGIDAQLPDEQALSVMPDFGLGGYRLIVPREEFFSAQALLREVEEKPSPYAACGRCGKAALRRSRGRTFPAILAALFGALVPFAPARGCLRCDACGHRQDADDKEIPA